MCLRLYPGLCTVLWGGSHGPFVPNCFDLSVGVSASATPHWTLWSNRVLHIRESMAALKSGAGSSLRFLEDAEGTGGILESWGASTSKKAHSWQVPILVLYYHDMVPGTTQFIFSGLKHFWV